MSRILLFSFLVVTPLLAALPDGLVAYYAENASTGHPDSTGSYPASVAAGAPTFTMAGKLGGAYAFAGSETGNSPSVRASIPVSAWQAGTVSVWIRPTNYSSGNALTVWQFPEVPSWGHLWLNINSATRKIDFHIVSV